MKLIKLTASLFACVVALAMMAFGTQFTSYVRTAARSVEESVQDTVPIEFELRRARDLIDQILPEMQSQIRQIATEEVQLASLEKSLQQRLARRESDNEQLIAMKKRAETTFVSIDGAQAKPGMEIYRRIDHKLKALQHLDVSIESDRQLIERRRDSLDASLIVLDETKDRKQELERQVESITARHRLLKSRQIKECKPKRSGSCGQADDLIQQLSRRLAIAEKILDHQAGFEEEQNMTRTETFSDSDAEAVMQRVDEYLARQ
ncbi:MAG: hypothetical protein AAF664_08880 [Planctomycetota bacterium]